MTKREMKETETKSPENGQILLYQSEDGETQVEVSLRDETIWLDAHQMAELFQRDRSVIVRHVRNIYKNNELDRSSTCAKNAQVAKDGKVRQMDFYNLDMTISVGRRTIASRAPWPMSSKPITNGNCIPALKRRPLTCFTSWSEITRL